MRQHSRLYGPSTRNRRSGPPESERVLADQGDRAKCDPSAEVHPTYPRERPIVPWAVAVWFSICRSATSLVHQELSGNQTNRTGIFVLYLRRFHSTRLAIQVSCPTSFSVRVCHRSKCLWMGHRIADQSHRQEPPHGNPHAKRTEL